MTTSMLTCDDCHGHGFIGQGADRHECARCNPVLFVLAPGKVRSKNDGQAHFITWDHLARLYGLWGREFAAVTQQGVRLVKRSYPGSGVEFHRLPDNDRRRLVFLRPRYDGNYQLPKE